MNSTFEVVTGSICGREHERTGINCQDAFSVLAGEDWLVAIVADGCGSGRHSEVGAKIGAELICGLLAEEIHASRATPFEELLERVRSRALKEMSTIARMLPGSLEDKVTNFLLFTLLGCVVTDRRAIVFSLGDGIVAVNGEISVLDHENMPPYLLYGLFPALLSAGGNAAAQFKVHADLDTNELQSILLASDGFAPVYSLGGDDPRQTQAKELGRVWEHDKFFANPARVTRELKLLGRAKTRADWQRQRMNITAGIFADDSTVVAVRRRQELLS